MSDNVNTYPEDAPVMLGPSETAKKLGITAATLTRYCKEGKINVIRLPSNQRRFTVEEVLRVQREMGIL